MRNKWLERQKELLAAAKTASRELTPEEQAEFDTLQRAIDDYDSFYRDSDDKENGANGDNEGDEDKKDNKKPKVGEENRGAEPVFSPETASSIMSMCRHFGLEPDSYIERGLSEEAARREIMEELMKRGAPIQTGIEVTADEETKFRSAVTDGMMLRAGLNPSTPAPGANDFRGLSLRDIAVECLERSNPKGNYRHMSSDSIFDLCMRDYYNPEAAFPAILDDAVKKSYTEGFEKAPVTFDKWVKIGTLSNFKKTTNHEYIQSFAGTMPEVPENGELTAYKPKDVAMPERQLKTYGIQFTMSRKAFIDDDIGLLTSMPRRYAEISQRQQNRQVYKVLMKNQKIYDGKTLFHNDHKNTLTTGTGITIGAIQKMIYMIGIQQDAAGNDIALNPDFIIVPFGMGDAVRVILTSETINTADNTQAKNPLYGRSIEIIEDVTLNRMITQGEAAPWFMGVKNNVLQMDYLNGQRQPNIRRSEKPGTLGFVWDVYGDWGLSALGYQCIARNPGVAIQVGE